MIDLLQDLDELLQTDQKFLLGKWIADAKSWGVTEGVSRLLHQSIQQHFFGGKWNSTSLMIIHTGKIAI